MDPLIKSKLEPIETLGISIHQLMDDNRYSLDVVSSITYLLNFTPNLKRLIFLENSEFSSDICSLLSTIEYPMISASDMETLFILSDAVIFFTVECMSSPEFTGLTCRHDHVLSIVFSLENLI